MTLPKFFCIIVFFSPNIFFFLIVAHVPTSLYHKYLLALHFFYTLFKIHCTFFFKHNFFRVLNRPGTFSPLYIAPAFLPRLIDPIGIWWSTNMHFIPECYLPLLPLHYCFCLHLLIFWC
jgi:hypothetical protein